MFANSPFILVQVVGNRSTIPQGGCLLILMSISPLAQVLHPTADGSHYQESYQSCHTQGQVKYFSILFLPNPKGRVILNVPSSSFTTTQLFPGWWGLEAVVGVVVFIALAIDGSFSCFLSQDLVILFSWQQNEPLTRIWLQNVICII